MIRKWEETNPDELQFCRRLSDGVYEIYQITAYEDIGEYYKYKLCHGIICRNEMDMDDVMYDAGCESMTELREKCGDDFDRRTAIAWFRMNIDKYRIAYPCFSYDEAKEVICAMVAGDAAVGKELKIC